MLAERLRKSNAFTLRVDCATEDTDQDGPARIISNSVSPFLRNFTVGQQGGDLFYHLHKQLLVRLGVIRSAAVRSPTISIDPVTQREIDGLLADLVPAPKKFEAA